MEGRDGMRAADADRQAVAERLRVAVDEGRLDLHEYDERLQRAYASRTYGELDALVTDLPAPAAPAASELATRPDAVPALSDAVPARPEGARSSSVTARWLAEVWLPYLRVIAIVVTVWAVTSALSTDLLYFWPAWVAGPWGGVLLVRTVAGLVGGEPQRQAEQRERRRERRRAKRARKRELAAAEGNTRDPEQALPPAASEERVDRELPAASEERRGVDRELPAASEERQGPVSAA
ncbi:DUF1707 domain-containing protein [Micromonospora echinofusca]|uniref:DUF1707 SHOCT-like domain-containing protein n=1 Tax=Micromonospora echinofusca TaxID=47858 RepID=UPI00202042AD|nr:DUF1707 domain-containing protein [Micromonospora sp. MSM11]MCL7459205.1 DUF1707 domain-containing protein [Micromonospora sp. MSM11]